jgi:hypothetical protein
MRRAARLRRPRGRRRLVALFQSTDWESRCERIIARFTAAALTLFDGPTRDRGYIEAEDRQGYPARLPLTTLSIGALNVTPGTFNDLMRLLGQKREAEFFCRFTHSFVEAQDLERRDGSAGS